MASARGVSARHADLRDLAVEIARQAGSYLAAHADDHVTVHAKSTPTDAVTDVDRASEALIVRLITENRPDDGILGEEGTSRSGRTGVRWIVDPLDGTVNYLYGIGAYAVSIGVEVDGVRVAGAVYDASRGQMYDAVLGGGARRDGTPLACTGITDLSLALVGTGFGYAADVRADQGAIVARLLPRVRDIRRIGSAALDLCAVASGRLDGYYERGINPWDRAAGLLIAAEAGARTGVFAEPGTDRELTVAAAPAIFDALTDAVRP
jgi:myo-inositol-1(or 4)-monophosphatase